MRDADFFELQILTRSHFQLRSSQIEAVFLSFFFVSVCVQRFGCEETHRVRCTVRRTQASEPTLTGSGLAAERHAESFCLCTLCLTMRLTAASAVVYDYVSTERCPPSALLLVSRPEPAPADCSLATERRAGRASGAKQRRYTAV